MLPQKKRQSAGSQSEKNGEKAKRGLSRGGDANALEKKKRQTWPKEKPRPWEKMSEGMVKAAVDSKAKKEEGVKGSQREVTGQKLKGGEEKEAKKSFRPQKKRGKPFGGGGKNFLNGCYWQKRTKRVWKYGEGPKIR